MPQEQETNHREVWKDVEARIPGCLHSAQPIAFPAGDLASDVIGKTGLVTVPPSLLGVEEHLDEELASRECV